MKDIYKYRFPHPLLMKQLIIYNKDDDDKSKAMYRKICNTILFADVTCDKIIKEFIDIDDNI